MVEKLDTIKHKIVEEIKDRLSLKGVTETNPTASLSFFEDDENSPHEIRKGRVEELVHGIGKRDFRERKCNVKIRYVTGGERLTTTILISIEKA